MVLEHVAQHAHLVIKTGTMFYSHLLCHCDLHMVNVVPVPQGLENCISKTRDQNILNSFLTKIMIDAVDLSFVQCLVNLFIQTMSGSKVGAEWLFDDHTPPAICLIELVGEPEQVNDIGENTRRGCHVIDAVARTIFPLFQNISQFLEICQVGIPP